MPCRKFGRRWRSVYKRNAAVVHRFIPTSCAAGTAVVFYQVDDGGHTWPGGPQYLPKAIGQFLTTHAR